MLDPGLVSFVLDALPPAPARVLEIGAGTGELAGYLRRDGYDLLAIDPAADTPVVEPIALHEVDAPAASFDAALAVLSLHHVEPLPESCRRLAELVRPDGVLVIDEFDIAAFDMTAARWWLGQRPAAHVDGAQAESIVAGLREHLHPLARVLEALRPWFDLGVPTRGPYLYRWQLSPELRGAEEARIASGRLAATGARVVGRRRR